MNLDERPSLAERYTAALSATNMMVVPDERRPVDLLIAAGWCQESLGTALYRLAREYDSVRAELRKRQGIDRIKTDRRAELRKAIRKSESAATRTAAVAELERRDELDRYDAAVERATIAAALRSLPKVQDMVNRWVDQHCIRRGADDLKVTDRLHIGQSALGIWLDPLCPHCHGSRFVGGYSVERIECRPCFGSGRRPVALHPTNEGQRVGLEVLASIESMVATVQRQMRSYVSHEAERYMQRASAQGAQAQLRARLRELNSSAAAED